MFLNTNERRIKLTNAFSELLYIMQENNIMSLDDVQMRDMVNKMKREIILKNHSYDIFLSSDGRYRTYIMVDGKRKQIAKSSKESLEDALVQYYNDKEINSKCTLKNLYPEWLDYKHTCATSPNTVKRIDNDWNKYYVENSVINIPITKLDFITLDRWAHSIIKEYTMTQKQYRNMALIMKQSLLYAVDKGYIKESPFERVRITGKIFSKTQKKKSESQVFLTDEQPRIEEEAFKEYTEKNTAVALAIPLAFQTGLRLGEIVALKYSDIEDDYLYVQRMEVRVPIKTSEGWTSNEYRIVNHAKSDAGTRKIFLTSRAHELLSFIKKANIENGYSNSEYLFLNEKGRIHGRALDYRLRKYCCNIGISEKSMHKIRKTFISTLIDNNVNINYIRETVGHESEETTYKSYCFNRKTPEQTEKVFEKALCS